jgi:hypothetical protein
MHLRVGRRSACEAAESRDTKERAVRPHLEDERPGSAKGTPVQPNGASTDAWPNPCFQAADGRREQHEQGETA